MGGLVPLGYDVRERERVVNQTEAATVRKIFARYLELGSVRLLKEKLDRDGIHSKRRLAGNGLESGGRSFSRGALYTLLSNPLYIGEIRHKGVCHPGSHSPIVERATWDKTARLLRAHRSRFEMRTFGAAPSPLIGKLFDESGEGLTPSHAVKGKRRYRYYVSRSLMKERAGQANGGWRVPAAELERIIAAATKRILDDRQLIIAAIEEATVDSSRIASLLKTAATFSAKLSAEVEASSAAALVDRVELRPDGIRLSLKLQASANGAVTDTPTLTLTREVPMRIWRRGVEKRFVVEGDRGVSSTVDHALLKAVARAHCWFEDLVAGRGTSMVELAKRDDLGKQYVSRVMRLAFLAPDIIEQIVTGRQPPGLTAQSLLTSRFALPLGWAAQKQALGFAPSVSRDNLRPNSAFLPPAAR
jgi:site-specific DNA recombinase